MGSCIKHTGTNPRERSQLLILLHSNGVAAVDRGTREIVTKYGGGPA